MRTIIYAAIFSVLTAPFVGADEMVVIKPGHEGGVRKAKNFMERWTGYLGPRAGIALTGRYFDDLGEAEKYLASTKPEYGVVSLDFYLGYRERYDLRPILQSSPNGRSEERFVVLVPTGSAAAGLAALGGKRVVGKYLAVPRFATSFILDGVPAEIVYNKQTLTSVKEVLGGTAAAAVVSEREWENLEKLEPYGSELAPAHVTDPIPTAVVVVFGDRPADGFTKALAGMKDDEEGKALLDEMWKSAGFEPIDEAALAGARRKFGS